jgi:hypothetical protein
MRSAQGLESSSYEVQLVVLFREASRYDSEATKVRRAENLKLHEVSPEGTHEKQNHM